MLRSAGSWLVAVSVALAACGGGGAADDDAGPDDAGPSDAGYPVSQKARVKFKGNDRLRNDLARALALDAAEVCTELGQYSCTHLVHQVALGGAEPYQLGLNEPLPFTTVTTPLAVDRVALFACRTRVDRDLAAPGGALIYAAPDIDGAIDTLYKRVVVRPPTDAEVDHLRQLHADIEARGADTTYRDWAIASCFAVTTSMEALFY